MKYSYKERFDAFRSSNKGNVRKLGEQGNIVKACSMLQYRKGEVRFDLKASYVDETRFDRSREMYLFCKLSMTRGPPLGNAIV